MSFKINLHTLVAIIIITSFLTYFVIKVLTPHPDVVLERKTVTTEVAEAVEIATTNNETIVNIDHSVPRKTEHEELAQQVRLSSFSFDEDKSVTESFLTSSGQIRQTNLSAVLNSDDFQGFLNKVRTADESAISIEREINMLEAFNKSRTNDIYGEDYTCRGKICALTYNHDSNSQFDLETVATLIKTICSVNLRPTHWVKH